MSHQFFRVKAKAKAKAKVNTKCLLETLHTSIMVTMGETQRKFVFFTKVSSPHGDVILKNYGVKTMTVKAFDTHHIGEIWELDLNSNDISAILAIMQMLADECNWSWESEEDIDYDKPEHGKYVELAKRLQNHYPDVDFEKFDLMALLWKFKYN